LCKFVYDELGPDILIHFLRFQSAENSTTD
jgi:hypothetical protein